MLYNLYVRKKAHKTPAYNILIRIRVDIRRIYDRLLGKILWNFWFRLWVHQTQKCVFSFLFKSSRVDIKTLGPASLNGQERMLLGEKKGEKIETII